MALGSQKAASDGVHQLRCSWIIEAIGKVLDRDRVELLRVWSLSRMFKVALLGVLGNGLEKLLNLSELLFV